jgi:OOP family OmpA-OmpF porin
MNAKQIVATGVVATMLGLGPTVASAEDGFYFSVFGGLSSIDIDEGALDASYGPVLTDRGQIVLNDGTDDHVFTGTASNYSSGSVDDSGIGWGVQVGYEFNPYVALEVGYVDLGKARQEGGSLLASYTTETDPFTFDVLTDVSTRVVSAGPTLAVVGKFPFGAGFSAHGRAGIYFADTRVRLKYSGTIDELSPSLPVETPVEFKAGTQELFIGLGAGWDFAEDFGLRLEVQRFFDVGDEDRTGEADATLLTLGVSFR